MRRAHLHVCLVALVAGSIVVQDVHPRSLISDEQVDARAYQKGIKEADEEIKEHRATIYTFGLRSFTEYLDRETGLPFEGIAGCEVDDEILGRAKGHNDRVRDHIKKHGLPDYSFKRWEKEIFALKSYFEAREKEERPQRLSPGGPVLKSPEGSVTIRPIRRKFEKDDGSIGEMLAVVVKVDGKDREPASVIWDESDSELVWGPKGSNFAVIRSRASHKPWYMALDLRSGRCLRESH